VWGLLPLPLTTKVPIKIGVSEPQGLEVRNCVKFLMGKCQTFLGEKFNFLIKLMYFAGIDCNITFSNPGPVV
jgi:hypothetical protein